MVKRKIYFRNPTSRQNFANAFEETPNLNLEVRPNLKMTVRGTMVRSEVYNSGCFCLESYIQRQHQHFMTFYISWHLRFHAIWDFMSLRFLRGQIRGQVSVCRAWNALPNNVEHKVEAIMEPFRSPGNLGPLGWQPSTLTTRLSETS